ncbi:membrane protein [Bacteroidales bacterium]|nr:membrane protein [Bacteroidales bacterium]
MKKILNKILNGALNKTLIALLFSSSLFYSCDFLDFEPEGSVPQEEFFSTKEQAAQAMTSMYGYLRGWNITGFSYLFISELTSDNIIKGSSPGDGDWAKSYTRFTFAKSEGQINDYWTSRYTAINLSNQVIHNIPTMSTAEVPQELKDRYVAEAKFLRAFHYFYLTRAFGGVVIMETSVSDPASVGAKYRKTQEECYDFIEKDLLEAIAVLPANLPSAELGRANVWAAKGILAKVYLYQEKWAESKALTDDIINNGGFILYPNFYDIFRHEQEFCSESLFEVLATEVIGNSAISNSSFCDIQGVRGQYGWGWMVPSDNLATAFDAEGDVVRKKATIIYRGDITPDGDTIKGVEVMDEVAIPRYSAKAYVAPKYSSVQGYGQDYNVRILRFAEILLMNAEAALYLGTDAATPLNMVRARVNLAPKSNPTITDIYTERRLELACEQDRFFDLVRTKQAATLLTPQGFKVDKNELFPIPENEIRKSGGTLIQNPGW